MHDFCFQNNLKLVHEQNIKLTFGTGSLILNLQKSLLNHIYCILKFYAGIRYRREPIYFDSFFFHSAKPCFLPFCKLTDCKVQFFK